MDITPGTAPQPSTPPVGLPPLSPPFISGDDAAYWAHGLIRHTEQREYGGVIVQDAHGRYYATQPIQSRHEQFYFGDVLQENEQGFPIAPKGYNLVGTYRSRGAIHDQMGALKLSPAQLRLVLSWFSTEEMQFNISMGKVVPAHYLSGPDGSLVKYVASDSALERALGIRLWNEQHSGQPSHRYAFVHSFILDCAAAGELWVVVANEDWGGRRGRVTARWTPGTAVASEVEVLPLCTRVCTHADEAAMIALAKAAPAASGFVLKGPQGYVATWPVPAAQPWFSLAALFPVDASAGFRLPEHCSLQGAYAVVPGNRQAAPGVAQPWLYEVMFSAAQLAAGIGQLRANAALRDKQYPSALYLQTRDAAVLRYRMTGSAQETALFAQDPQGRFNDDGSDERMRAGTLAARDYVVRVAQAGALAVIRTSAVWDAQATVTPAWQPYSRRQVALSPAFVSADDAARYAHAQLGYSHVLNHAALILQRADQRFVATEWVPTDRPRFALDAVYPVDAKGVPIILAPGCRLHALCCSRRRPVEPPAPGDREAQVAAQMFMDTDIHTLLANRQVVPRGYLSGAANSLIAYTSQDLQSYNERELLERVTPVAGISTVARALSEGSLLPSAFVREQAYVGRLRVVSASRLWGPVGDLPEDWEPGANVEPLQLPETPMLGPVFATAAQAVREAHERTLDRYGRSPCGAGVVLRHPTEGQYVVTEAVPAGLLDRLLQTCRVAAPLRQAGFEVDSFYLSGVDIPPGASTAGRWLARHFISPGDLHAAFYDNFTARRLPLGQRLLVHIATMEGALLEYDGGTGDTVFGADSRQGLVRFEQGLASGAMATADFVAQVAGSGQLHVIEGSECWDRMGRVNAAWKPFSRVTRRRLSPAFSSADEAARYVSRRFGARHGKVFGGLILRSAAGLFAATEPLAVQVENFDMQWVRSKELVERGLFLGGSTVVAFYHSCSAYEPQFATTDTQWDVYRNMFSTTFVAHVLKGLASDPRTDYLLCNDGALLRYRFTASKAQRALAAELNVAPGQAPWHLYNPLEEQIRGGTLNPSEWVNRLAEAGELAVLEGSQLWGVARPVVSFVAYQEQERSPDGHVQADTGLSPLFSQAADAARYLGRLNLRRGEMTVGFILKAAHYEHYQATLPLPVHESAALALSQVFVEGQLPQGYAVNGVYLCAGADVQTSASDLARHFFWPQDLALGLATATRHGRVPLYLCCADDALLMLETTHPVAELASVDAATAYSGQLGSGAIRLENYIHTLAAANPFTVLHTSPFWSETSLVTAQWQPYQATPAPAATHQRFALSPVYLHADDAARYAQRLVGPYTGDDYLGAILEQVEKRAYVAVEPLKDNDPDAVPSAEQRLFWTPARAQTSDHRVPLPQFPAGHVIVMTHQFYKSDFAGKDAPTTSLGANFISWSYLFRYTRDLKRFAFYIQHYYLSTRDGALLRYTPDLRVDSREDELVHQFARIGVYEAPQMLALMAPYKTLTVVRAGRYWRQRGLIEADADQAPPVIEEAPATPLPPVSGGFHREKDEF